MLCVCLFKLSFAGPYVSMCVCVRVWVNHYFLSLMNHCLLFYCVYFASFVLFPFFDCKVCFSERSSYRVHVVDGGIMGHCL